MENELSLPLVSIVMPTYNMAHYLFESIQSIISQSYKNLEIIICNDGSTDNTSEIINQFNDKRIVYLSRKHDYIASLNYSMLQAKGKYIARMDADDIMLHERIENQVKYMEANPQIDICCGSIQNFGRREDKCLALLRYQDIAASLLIQNTIAHPCVMIRKKSMDAFICQHGQLYHPDYIYAEDYHLWTKFIIDGFRIEGIPELLIKHRICKEAVTVRLSTISKQNANKVQKDFLKYVIQQILNNHPELVSITEEIIKLSSKGILNLTDVQRLIYTIYRKILK